MYEDTSAGPVAEKPPVPVARLTDAAAAWVRTIWPWLLGHVAASVVAFVSAKLGVVLSEGWVFELVALAAASGIYGTGRWLEQRTGTGWLARLARWGGRWLLSIGLHTGTPVYIPQAGTSR